MGKTKAEGNLSFPSDHLFLFLPPVKQFPWLTVTPFREERMKEPWRWWGARNAFKGMVLFFFVFFLEIQSIVVSGVSY